MSYLETKYLNLLSTHLRNFKRKSGSLWNFSCPFCGDSQKSTRKARGYVYSTDKGLLYTCHNCSLTTNVPKLVKHLSPTLYDEYVKEMLADKYRPAKVEEPPLETLVRTNDMDLMKEWLKLVPVYQLPDNHPCKVYVEKRMIPKEWFFRLWYCPAFFEWTNGLIPDKFSARALAHDEGRLIIPFLAENKKVFGYQGRSLKENLDKNEQKYYTIMLESRPAIFGLDRVDMDRKHYVLEGPIDAMFLPNAVASCGGVLWGNENAVIVYDNEPRSLETCKKIQKAINRGYKVCIWPNGVWEKDVNEMVLGGLSPDFVKDMIDKCTWSDLEAQLNFDVWKKR